MTNGKPSVSEFLMPVVVGSYSLIHGSILAMTENPMIQLLGVGLLTTVPAFTYYACKGYQVLVQRPVAAAEALEPQPERLEMEEEVAA